MKMVEKREKVVMVKVAVLQNLYHIDTSFVTEFWGW